MQGISSNDIRLLYHSGMSAGRPPKQPRTSFGERLATARERAGLTQKQLAQKLGTSQRVITYWEREPVALRADQLTDLAAALDVSADYLFGKAPTQPRRRGTGPVGKVQRVFEAVSKLPRHQQQHIISVVEDMITAKNLRNQAA